MSQGFVYWISSDPPEPVKVGWTAKHPEIRIGNLQLGNPRILRVLGSIEGPKELESACHEALAGYRHRGEWFERDAALDLLIELGTGDALGVALKRFEQARKRAYS